MTIDKNAGLEQIDDALRRYDAFVKQHRRGTRNTDEDFEREHTEITWHIMATLDRLAPPGSVYRVRGTSENELAGALKALRIAYENDCLRSMRELIHGATFSDFLDMADHLLKESYKDAAATIAGGVLEQHLRALCTKHGVSPVPGNLNALNDALYRQPPGIYPSQWMKQITAWADTRNNAAHGHYDKVNAGLVETMIAGIRLFISSHAA